MVLYKNVYFVIIIFENNINLLCISKIDGTRVPLSDLFDIKNKFENSDNPYYLDFRKMELTNPNNSDF